MPERFIPYGFAFVNFSRRLRGLKRIKGKDKFKSNSVNPEIDAFQFGLTNKILNDGSLTVT